MVLGQGRCPEQQGVGENGSAIRVGASHRSNLRPQGMREEAAHAKRVRRAVARVGQ